MIKNEWKSLLRNKLMLIVVIGIIVIPIIYAGLFLKSMWDPYGNVDSLPVAVVNEDKPVEYNGKTLSIGKDMTDELKDNDSMAFNIVDSKTAEDGLANGTYYMVIKIPENFSANAATVMDNDPKQMELSYETNPGTNYIASKLSETAMLKLRDNIASKVTETYTETVFDSISEAGDGMQEAADGSGKIEDGLNTAADGNKTITKNLKNLSSNKTYEWDPATSQWKLQTYRPLPKLYPERTNSWEAGLNAKFFNNSLSLEVTWYKANTRKQTFQVPLSGTAVYATMYAQSGNIENKGMEFSLGYNKSWGDFSWNSNLTFSFNKNKIVELLDDAVDDEGNHYSLSEIDKGGIGSAKVILRKGGSMGDMYVTNRLKRDNEGNVYIDKASQNVKKEDIKNSDEFIHIGSVLPKSNLGFRNDFSYKGISLGFMLAARFGGIVISPTQAVMDQFGVSKVTALARDNEGVPVNNGKVDPQTYYTEVGGISGLMSNYVYSATNVRLQELSVGYSLPAKWFNNKCNLSLSITGHNLWMIYNKAPFDPEATASTGTYYQGVDYFMQPSLRSWGFNVKIQF